MSRYAVISLFIGYGNVSATPRMHFNILKDAMLAVMLVFVVQMSVTDWSTLKRVHPGHAAAAAVHIAR